MAGVSKNKRRKEVKSFMETERQKGTQGKIKRPLWYTIVFFTCFFLGLMAMVAEAFTANARFSTLATGSFLVGMIVTIAVWRQVQVP
jgi:hypothetical protein